MNQKTVMVTGGAGYVGSHCCKAFSKAGWRVVTLDNLSRGWANLVKWGPLVQADISDEAAVTTAMMSYKPDLVAHFAAYAYVGESVSTPDIYYQNNSAGTLSLLGSMRRAAVDKILFSSTCATYGHPVRLPIDETHPQLPVNPYGWSKLIVERMLEDFSRAYGISATSLRYFNAAGADPDGETGEQHDPETHAIPLAIRAALSRDGEFVVYGTELDTRDGSCVRDYIHVSDLADAHVLAGERLLAQVGADIFNLGTGSGTTVLEIAAAVNAALGGKLRVRCGPPRIGDPAVLVASAQKAREQLGWHPKRSNIQEIIQTALAWQQQLASGG